MPLQQKRCVLAFTDLRTDRHSKFLIMINSAIAQPWSQQRWQAFACLPRA